MSNRKLLRLQSFVAVYRWTNKAGVVATSISGRTFASEALARKLPRGPFVPERMEVIDVIEVEWVQKS